MGKLNTKIKFLIIAVYTLLLFLLVFVLFSPKAIDLYESYGRTPYDDHIGIMIKVTENRQSVLETYDSNSETDKKNKEGKNEKATYDVTISLIKLRVETLKNITVNLRHLMDFGEKEFTIHILNTDEIVHNMEELVVIAGMFVR